MTLVVDSRWVVLDSIAQAELAMQGYKAKQRMRQRGYVWVLMSKTIEREFDDAVPDNSSDAG